MELFKIMADFFGLGMEIVTFVDLIKWLVGAILATVILCLLFKFMFQATWKVERKIR